MESRNSKVFGLVVIVLVCLICGSLVLFLNIKKSNDSKKSEIDKVNSSISIVDYDSIDKELSFYKNIDSEISKKYDEYYTNISKLEQKIIDGKTNVKIAYLTFDDGPYDLTYKVLDLLKANNVRATFFVLGKDGVEDRYIRIVNEGHTLANHTYYHNIGKGLYNSTEGFMSQVKKLEEYLYGITGYRTTLVRFPGGSPTAGSLKDSIVNELHNNGYKYVDWTSETGDGSSKKLALKSTWDWYRDTTAGKDIIVLLMHDYNYSTFNDLQRIIDDLRSRGFIFLPLHNKSVMAN